MTFNSGYVTSTLTGSVSTGYPTPTTSQEPHNVYYILSTTATTSQIATPDASHDVYFIGCIVNNWAAVSPVLSLFDANAGTGPAVSPNTIYLDSNGHLVYDVFPVVGQRSYFPQIPIKLTNGLRMLAGGASSNANLFIFYMVVNK